eukprot:TRINITY_DN7188_c0_g1_i1.p1 TRINITY_DN7188_c0_g1~~TRINITY_DN7188_c0_g1_i1.p1  ORF type:complete len:476 (+),score=102.68 TRINITY_DN7188_c0_g1_i1:65-1492(+)
MRSPPACVTFMFLVSLASGADTCTDGLLPEQQETLLLQHQVSVDAEQDTDFDQSALAFFFGTDANTKHDSAASENASSSRYTTDASGDLADGGSSSSSGSAAGTESDKTGADGSASKSGSAAGNKSHAAGNSSNKSSKKKTLNDRSASKSVSAAGNKSHASGHSSKTSSKKKTPHDRSASKNGSAAGNKSHAAGNSTQNASPSKKTTLKDRNATKNGSDSSNKSKHGSEASNASLPRKEQLMFDTLTARLNTSMQALASASELMSDFKKQTALEIHYGEEAALAEASKLDALHEMNRLLNESMSLEHDALEGISAQVTSGPTLPNATAKATNASFKASETAAQAAKLAQVVHISESNYSAAIAKAFEARRKRDALAKSILKFVNSSLVDEGNLTGLVEAINSTYYLNLSGDTKINAKVNASERNLTEIVKADIERFSPSNTTTTTTVPRDAPDPSVPSITITIINESDAKKDHEK